VVLISEPEQAKWHDAHDLPPGWRKCLLKPTSMRNLRAKQNLYYSPGGQLFTSKANVVKFLAKNGVENIKSVEEDRTSPEKKKNIPAIANRRKKVPESISPIDKYIPEIIYSPTTSSSPLSAPSPPPSHSADQEDLTDDSDSTSQASSSTSLPSPREEEEEESDCISISDEDIPETVKEEKPTNNKKRKLPNVEKTEPSTKKCRLTVPLVQEPSLAQHKVLMAAYSEWPIPFPKLVKELETETKFPAKNIVAWFLKETEENIKKLFDGQEN